jgi:diguanylate cyclase (GGDEF)-like protein
VARAVLPAPRRAYWTALVDMPERSIRLTTAVLVPCFAVIGLIAAQSPGGPHTVPRLVLLGLIDATTIPVCLFVARTRLGKLWWREPTGAGQVLTTAFVGYADIGMAAVLFLFIDFEGALYGTALFAIIGVYAGHFTNRLTVIAHVVFTSVVITVLGWLTWRQGTHDTAGAIAKWLVSMLSVNCTLGMLSGFSRGVQRALDTQLDNAARDPLTGLLNRRGLAMWSEQLLDNHSHTVGFVIADLDRFKSVNDRHGHATGDAVLVLASKRLQSVLDADVAIARTGGEEFAVVVAATCEQIVDIAETIRAALHDRHDDIPVTVSVGVSTMSADDPIRGQACDALTAGLRHADIALYDAKRLGRNRVQIYDPRDQFYPLPDRRQRRGHGQPDI